MTGDDAIERVQPVSDVLVQKLPDGDSVLLHMGTEIYFGLDEVATRMWESLAAGKSAGETVDALVDVYDVDAEQLEADVHALLARLLEAGLVEVADE